MFEELLPDIKTSRQMVSLAATAGTNDPEKIRVAVLDTGIDPTDAMIQEGMSTLRIADKRSWVGSPENYVDTDGHGTHATRLLLSLAPAAEIYIAKIADDKSIDSKDVYLIAKVGLSWSRDIGR